MATYSKDNGHYNQPLDFSGTFGKVDNTALALINCCKYVYKDKGGEYTYNAVRFNESGLVYFEKVYRKNSTNY